MAEWNPCEAKAGSNTRAESATGDSDRRALEQPVPHFFLLPVDVIFFLLPPQREFSFEFGEQ
jgi:hypothetical protein